MGEESGHSTKVMAEGVGYPARVACGSSDDEGVGPKFRLVDWFELTDRSARKELCALLCLQPRTQQEQGSDVAYHRTAVVSDPHRLRRTGSRE